ncbi:bifunctional UDP-4-keto-pentose/UDP-xylose synthase [Aminithiophilus ramosus]|uniref:Bifunctional UDP-4-keto-pentose/UDP-xylose synthase n=3 Tax=Synergistales TaxID=649776 RepID=A0A9Q7A682_9BACT|nr:bifunctional UDP-4-keto-pentose/UDP-xylose synthase [Aminithiophilus ramosus]QTX31755.1 bifunctional UDP-4-keto-pentose/UDP-xylose synthase [Aminithiophilus ramosus]QVL37674.1 bifunctional UDP-4-keto-pentose/UDP-xylose synthase [Synergistota bacterium]
MKVLILGANGFIGSHLCEAILDQRDWTVTAHDLVGGNLGNCLGRERFSLRLGDAFSDLDWIEEQVASCDVVLPLVGVAKPSFYLSRPLWTFELDFELNLKIVRFCVARKKRVIFPSTSEVYGMSSDRILYEESSPLTVGPIGKMRWIYSCAKQMMDRVIVAYGQEEGLRYTLFRPFNWIGPRLDSFDDARERRARSVTQFVYDIVQGRPVTLVNGGGQRRSFTWIGDGIEALMAIIGDEKGSDGKIFNIGNPANNRSISELVDHLVRILETFPETAQQARSAEIVVQSAESYYGNGYDDMQDRVPSIENIERCLGWRPRTTLDEALRRTVEGLIRP